MKRCDVLKVLRQRTMGAVICHADDEPVDELHMVLDAIQYLPAESVRRGRLVFHCRRADGRVLAI